jgi:cytochrome b561
MAIMIFVMFLAMLGFASVTNDTEHMTMLVGHSSSGTIITMLILIRFTKRFVVKSPVPVQDIEPKQRLAATLVQYALYFLMLLVPISGYLTARLHELPVMAFTAFNISQTEQNGYNEAAFAALRIVHETSIKVLMLLVAMHVGAALYHRWVKKDNVMNTMLRGPKKAK